MHGRRSKLQREEWSDPSQHSSQGCVWWGVWRCPPQVSLCALVQNTTLFLQRVPRELRPCQESLLLLIDLGLKWSSEGGITVEERLLWSQSLNHKFYLSSEMTRRPAGTYNGWAMSASLLSHWKQALLGRLIYLCFMAYFVMKKSQ